MPADLDAVWEIDRAERAIIMAGLVVFAYFYLVLLVESWGPVSQRESHDNARRLAANPGERQGDRIWIESKILAFLLKCECSVDEHLVFEAECSQSPLFHTALADKSGTCYFCLLFMVIVVPSDQRSG